MSIKTFRSGLEDKKGCEVHRRKENTRMGSPVDNSILLRLDSGPSMHLEKFYGSILSSVVE